MMKTTIATLILGIVATASVFGDTILYTNDCSSTAAFSSNNPTELTIVATGGIDLGPCVQYVSRVSKLDLTLTLPESIDLSSNSAGKEFYLSYSVSGLSTYAQNTTYSIYAIVDGTQKLIAYSGRTQVYNAGWTTIDHLNLQESATETPYLSGTLTGFVFHVYTADKILRLDSISLSQVPEPMTMGLLCLGSFGILLRRKK